MSNLIEKPGKEAILGKVHTHCFGKRAVYKVGEKYYVPRKGWRGQILDILLNEEDFEKIEEDPPIRETVYLELSTGDASLYIDDHLEEGGGYVPHLSLHNVYWYDLENNQTINAYYFAKNRFIPFVAVHPGQKDSIKNIDSLAGLHPIKGVKIAHMESMDFSVDQLIGNPLMDVVQKRGLVLLIHTGTGKETNADKIHVTLDYALKVAKAYKDVNFVLAHLGRLHEKILDAFQLDNVYFDTSGLSMWQNWSAFISNKPLDIFKSSTPIQVIERLVDLGYENKLLFGSDEPYVTYAEEIRIILGAEISEKARRNIFAVNSKKLLGEE